MPALPPASHFGKAKYCDCLKNSRLALMQCQTMPLRRQKSISIRLNNGYTVFQYAGDGTNLHDENWLRRKFNTVKTLEKSSLYTYMLLRKNEETMENLFLDEKEYACCGGGFPVRVEEVGVIGAILVSGLDHVSDHDFIVKCVSRYLHIDEVPRIRGDILS